MDVEQAITFHVASATVKCIWPMPTCKWTEDMTVGMNVVNAEGEGEYTNLIKGVIMKEELLKGLSEEQIAKIKACKSQEEVLKLAKEEGIELTDEQLAAVSGGGCVSTVRCPNCGSDNVDRVVVGGSTHCTDIYYVCRNCGNKFHND